MGRGPPICPDPTAPGTFVLKDLVSFPAPTPPPQLLTFKVFRSGIEDSSGVRLPFSCGDRQRCVRAVLYAEGACGCHHAWTYPDSCVGPRGQGWSKLYCISRLTCPSVLRGGPTP
jgi:hypothetical protein